MATAAGIYDTDLKSTRARHHGRPNRSPNVIAAAGDLSLHQLSPGQRGRAGRGGDVSGRVLVVGSKEENPIAGDNVGCKGGRECRPTGGSLAAIERLHLSPSHLLSPR